MIGDSKLVDVQSAVREVAARPLRVGDDDSGVGSVRVTSAFRSLEGAVSGDCAGVRWARKWQGSAVVYRPG